MNKTTKVLLAIVFIAIAVILVIEGRTMFQKTGGSPTEESQTGNGDSASTGNKPVVGGIGDEMIKSAKLNIPGVTGTEKTTLAALPGNLAALVRAGNSDLSVSKVAYSGGKTGFKVEYMVGETEVKSFFQKFSQEAVQNGWTSLVTAWSTAFGFFEVQDGSYEARVSMFPADSKMVVVVEAVAK